MFGKIVDSFKESAGNTMRLTALALVAMVTLIVTIAFLCAAGFIYIHQHYGVIEACFAGAGVFFFVTIIVVGILMAQRSETEQRAKAARLAAQQKASEKSLLQTALSDPLVLATGLQVVRAIGVKRLIPILAVSGVALGLWAGRANGGPTEAANDDA